MRLALTIAILAAAALPGAARAACSINAISGASFGNYNPYSAVALTTTINGSFSCTSNATVTVSTGSSGVYATRTLRSGANVLNYNLYFDASYTVVVGDGGPGTAVYNVGAGNNQPILVFGRIPPLQDVAFGNYTDTIVVTFTF